MMQDKSVNPYGNANAAPMRSNSTLFGKHRASENPDLRISDPYAVNGMDYATLDKKSGIGRVSDFKRNASMDLGNYTDIGNGLDQTSHQAKRDKIRLLKGKRHTASAMDVVSELDSLTRKC